MVKSANRKMLTAFLSVVAVLALSLCVLFAMPVRVKADETVTSESLLDLSKGHNNNAGTTFSSSNTIFIHWAAGSQSGSTWGGLNLKCGDNDLSDLIVLTTADKSQTLKAWKAESLITRVITYGDMMGINLEEKGLTKAQVKSVTLKAGLAPIKDSAGYGDNNATTGTADMTKALPEDITIYLNADGSVQTYRPFDELLDLSKNVEGLTPNNFMGPLFSIFWKDSNQPATWGVAKAKIGEGVVGDYIVITKKDGESKTVTEWGNGITRIISYGTETGINFEGTVKKADVKSITLKKGFAPLVKGDNADNWGGDGTVFDTDSTKALEADITLFPNTVTGKWEVETTSLTVKTQPDKLDYAVGESFDPTGMVVTATTTVTGVKDINVVNGMYTAEDFSKAGEKTVTVSYGGKTVTISVNVTAVARNLESIAYKSGTASIEQNGSLSEMTVTDLLLTATYDNGDTEDVTVTADMIAVDPGELGVKDGVVSYKQGSVVKTCTVKVNVTARTTEFNKNNIYPIPIDGYYPGEDGGDRTVNDSGINVWFTTNAGYGGEAIFDGLGERPGWYDDNETIHNNVKAHVLINGKTFEELNAEGWGLERMFMGWYRTGLWTLRIHDKSQNKAKDIETITILKGFRLYNKNLQPVGTPTICDYTMQCVDKPNTDQKMLIRKVESLSVESEPNKKSYYTDEKFDKTGLTVKAVYTDGGTRTFEVKDRMISCNLTVAGDEVPVTITYNGKTAVVNVKTEVRPVTLTGITLKEGSLITLTQYKRDFTISDGAKVIAHYSDDTTEEVDLTLDMISGLTNETAGSYKATVTYQNFTAQIDYTVNAYDAENSTLSGIKYGLEYDAGIEFVKFQFTRTDKDNLKAYRNVNYSNSAIIGKTLGDLFKINGVTVTELVEQGKVKRIWMYGEAIGFHVDDAEFKKVVLGGATIEILPGFCWVVNPGTPADSWVDNNLDYVKTLIPVENAVVTKPMYFRFADGVVKKVVEDIVLVGTPKANYYVGDVISTEGLTLAVTYKGFDKAETENVTAAMCSADLTSAGEKVVTVSFEGKTTKFNITVENVSLTDIEITNEPEKKVYDFGIDDELILDGLTVKAYYDNNTEKELDIADLTIEGFTARKFGKQTLTVRYGEFSKTFEISMENVSKNQYLWLKYNDAAMSFEASVHHSLVINFGLQGVSEGGGLSSFWRVDKYPFVADYMLINGVKVSELIKTGKVTRLCVWTNQLVIHLDTNDLVPSTMIDTIYPKTPQEYIEGVSEVVDTVTFLPGFQWYTTNATSEKEKIEGWGDDSYNKGIALKGAVLKETITIKNNDGFGWIRELKKDADGNIAEDALVIKSMPDKTEYLLGEALKLSGMTIVATFEDGGTTIINPEFSMTDGYDRNKLGEQTITYTYAGGTVTFTVTVKEKVEDSSADGSDCSGCDGAVTGSYVALFGLAVAMAYTLKRKKK